MGPGAQDKMLSLWQRMLADGSGSVMPLPSLKQPCGLIPSSAVTDACSMVNPVKVWDEMKIDCGRDDNNECMFENYGILVR